MGGRVGLRETAIEVRLRKGVERMGGLCEKFTSPGRRHVPDRLVTLPGGRMYLVECKRPGESPRAGQVRDHERRARLGVIVPVPSTPEEVDALLERWRAD